MLREQIYYQARLKEYGVELSEFKENPTAVLRQCGQESAIECIKRGFKPLLPEQARVAKRIQSEWLEIDKRTVSTTQRVNEHDAYLTVPHGSTC